MRGTIYLLKDDGRIEKRVVTMDTSDRQGFVAEAERLWGRSDCQLEYGPIAPPWNRL